MALEPQVIKVSKYPNTVIILSIIYLLSSSFGSIICTVFFQWLISLFLFHSADFYNNQCRSKLCKNSNQGGKSCSTKYCIIQIFQSYSNANFQTPCPMLYPVNGSQKYNVQVSVKGKYTHKNTFTRCLLISFFVVPIFCTSISWHWGLQRGWGAVVQRTLHFLFL